MASAIRISWHLDPDGGGEALVFQVCIRLPGLRRPNPLRDRGGDSRGRARTRGVATLRFKLGYYSDADLQRLLDEGRE